MTKILLPFAVLFLFAGCEKISGKSPAQKAAAKEAATQAQARAAAKFAAVKEGVSPATAALTGKAGEALVGLLCSSPGLMEDIENNMYLMEALSGDGGSHEDLKRHVLETRRHYAGPLKKALPPRGVSYEEFLAYAGKTLPGLATPEGKLAFGAFVKEKCPRNAVLAEKTGAALLRYCADPAY